MNIKDIPTHVWLILCFVVLLVAGQAIALADNIVADGDGLTPVNTNNLAFGSVACGGTTSKSVALAIDRNGQGQVYANSAVVTVIVTSFVGPYSEQIRVVGEAARPQFLPYKAKMTLLDVMIAVGGLTDFAAGNSATILRSSEGNKQYSVRLKDLVKRGDVSANVEMRPGDILVIPQSFF